MKLVRLAICVLLLAAVGDAVLADERSSRRLKARWRNAFLGAVRDPGTWVPAASGMLMGATGWDHEVSDWARRHTPLFGDDAARTSDHLRGATEAGLVASTIAASRQEASWNALPQRALGTLAAVHLSGATVSSLKSWSGRERPDGSNSRSFPSGHSTGAFINATLTRRSIDELAVPPLARRSMKIGVTSLAAGTAWARVEAGVHYPSDVLFGAALGNFMGRFLGDVLLPDKLDMELAVDLDPDEPQVHVAWQF